MDNTSINRESFYRGVPIERQGGIQFGRTVDTVAVIGTILGSFVFRIEEHEAAGKG